MKKVFLLLLMMLMISGCGEEKVSENVNTAKTGGTITVGIDEFAPFGFTDESGNIAGFDVDLAKEVSKRMGVEVNFKFIEWANKEYEISYGRVDMIWNGCDIMDDYNRYMIFSRPYMDNRQIILVAAGNPHGIHGVENLAGKIVGTQAGSSSEFYIDGNEELKKSFAEFKTYVRIAEGFAGLSTGEYDALIIDEAAAQFEMKKKPDAFEVVDVTVGSLQKIGIGFRKDNVELRDKVQAAFDEIIADGTAQKISERWFGADLIKTQK